MLGRGLIVTAAASRHAAPVGAVLPLEGVDPYRQRPQHPPGRARQ